MGAEQVEAGHSLGCLEHNGATIGTRLLRVDAGDQQLVEQIRELNTLWYRGVRHDRPPWYHTRLWPTAF